jgi:peptide/nickel transport system substrate-binding protein
MRIRRVDEPQYWRRLSGFDFDMMQRTWAVSLSPGAEQRNRWSARAAGQDGSLNYAGARSPAADALIDALLAAESRADFVSAVRALDRVLLSGFYVVPLFHVADYWLASDAALKHPSTMPLLGVSIDTWWREPR